MEKYVIFETGGKQLKATTGDFLWIERIEVEVGKTITFDKVYVINDGKESYIGTPKLNAKVIATVVKQGLEKKKTIFKTKQKSNWKTKKGHRQQYTKIIVNKVELDGKVIYEEKFVAKEKVKHVPAKKIDAKKTPTKKELDTTTTVIVKSNTKNKATKKPSKSTKTLNTVTPKNKK